MKTYEQQTSPFGATASTCSPAVSRASRSASRANARVRPTTATSGPQCSELFGLFDRAGSWARTFSESLIGRREWFSSMCALIWRRQDTRCKRTLYQLRASVLPICDTEHGLLPTVVTQGLKVHGKSGSEPWPPALLPTPVASDCGSGRVNRSLSKVHPSGRRSRLQRGWGCCRRRRPAMRKTIRFLSVMPSGRAESSTMS